MPRVLDLNLIVVLQIVGVVLLAKFVFLVLAARYPNKVTTTLAAL